MCLMKQYQQESNNFLEKAQSQPTNCKYHCIVSRMLVAGLLLFAPLVTADPVRVIETNSFRSEAPPQSRCLLLLLLLLLQL